jgi:DNA-binding response OmpR family regulator
VDVLLVAWQWRPRVLLNAQLIEQGFTVRATDGWDEAELHLLARRADPPLVVFDLDGEPHPSASLHTLVRLVPADRVLILTASAALPEEGVRAIGFGRVLARPFSVADVVREVTAIARLER